MPDIGWNLLAALGGFLVSNLGKLGQESVTGYLSLKNARRHVLDMLVTETANLPVTVKKQVRPGEFVVSAMHGSVSRATREALSTYLQAARSSPLRWPGDAKAVAALAPRLQFDGASIGKIAFFAICMLISRWRSPRAIRHYADLTAEAVSATAESEDPRNARAVGDQERALLLRQVEEARQAMPGRPLKLCDEPPRRNPTADIPAFPDDGDTFLEAGEISPVSREAFTRCPKTL